MSVISEPEIGFWRLRLIEFAALVSAGAALALEIVAGRMLAPYVGMSLYTWTAVISAVLAGLAAGHWIGGIMAAADIVAIRRRVVWSFAASAALAALAPLLVRWIAGGLADGMAPIPKILALSALAFGPPSLAAGLLSPMLTTLALEAAPDRRSQMLGRMYALGALGGIAGALAAGYLMVAWLGVAASTAAVAGSYAVLALAFALAFRSTGAAKGIAAAGLVVALLAGLGAAAGWPSALASPCAVESRYYCLRVHQISPSERALVIDHLGHGVNDRDDPDRMPAHYAQLSAELMKARAVGGGLKAFFIGGGAYTLPRAWALADESARLTVAEIDPAVTEIARDDLWLPDLPNIEVLHEDARIALANLPPSGQFDAIVGDAFHDISTPSHLTTLEFANIVQARLNPAGLYFATAIDEPRRPLFLWSLAKTLKEAFPVVEVWLDPEEASAGGRAVFLIAAGELPSPTGTLRSPYGDRTWIRWPAADLARRLAREDVLVLTDDHAPVDRLLKPVAAISD